MNVTPLHMIKGHKRGGRGEASAHDNRIKKVALLFLDGS